MTWDQASLFVILAFTLSLFVWGRWRFDIVAVLALLASVFAGIVPAQHAFSGFGHPAVITVVAVLVLSRALQLSGIVDHLARFLKPARHGPSAQVGAVTVLTGFFSAFMNNVGALALMLPVALKAAQDSKRPPSQLLMPLSFASLLGGLVTLIGTPPNIIIASFRGQAVGENFGMFDFLPVGLTVACVGILYITFIGWRLVPRHRRGEVQLSDAFQIEHYATEVKISQESPLASQRVRDLERMGDNDVAVIAIIRDKQRILAPANTEMLYAGDSLVLQGSPAALETLIEQAQFEQLGNKKIAAENLRSERVVLVEAVLMPNAAVEGRPIRAVKLHERFGVNLLALARQGRNPETRLRRTRFEVGDVLLLQGDREAVFDAVQSLGCMPLGERDRRPVRRRHHALLPVGLFAAAILTAALGLIPVHIAFVTAVAATILTDSLSIRDAYRSIEWPVVVLLGCLIPVGEALQSTGGTILIAQGIIGLAGELPLWGMLGLLMVVSMALSDLVHNSPTAVLMAPVSISIAATLDMPVEPFLMAVAVGAASPYLTPIGHQSNTLVMGPGGYHFSDYWKVGLPLDLIILAVAVPMIEWVWL